jgi:hypothetical protein
VITTKLTTSFVRGAAELEETPRGLRPHRLPEWARNRFPEPQLLMMEGQTSGVRVVLATTARAVELTCHPNRVAYRGTSRPRGSIDLVIDGVLMASAELGGGDAVEVDIQKGTSSFLSGDSHTVKFEDLPEGDKVVEIWLPHNEAVELIALRTDEPVRPAGTDRPLWLHHGSSISHGSNTSTPSRTWPAIAARRSGVELRNLGLGGSALVDPFLARVIRDAPADLISVKLGINVVNADAMRLRTFVPAVTGFLDLIRDGHPETPLVLVSPLFCGIHEDTPGPGQVDPASFGTDQVKFIATGRSGDRELGRLTLRVIREALESLAALRADDPNLHYLDGTALYSEEDAVDHPLPDALHPDTATHQLIGERFADYAFRAGGPFGNR